MTEASENRSLATLLGLIAIALWAALASMTVAIADIPPLQRLAISFSVATLASFVVLWARREQPLRDALLIRPSYWLLGVYGLLGYHAFYFIALSGPLPLQANLVNYLWPLLITVLAPLLSGQAREDGAPARWRTLIGAGFGFAGTALALGGGTGGGFSSYGAVTLVAAAIAALIWSSYSVLLARFADVPSTAVATLCGVCAIGAASLHFAFETTAWRLNRDAWVILIAQGVGPVGLAFTFWDTAMKRGNVPLLAVVCYTIPIASMALLVVTGQANADAGLWAGAVLVAFGAAVATAPGNKG